MEVAVLEVAIMQVASVEVASEDVMTSDPTTAAGGPETDVTGGSFCPAGDDPDFCLPVIFDWDTL